jgi:hypothetical protein
MLAAERTNEDHLTAHRSGSALCLSTSELLAAGHSHGQSTLQRSLHG